MFDIGVFLNTCSSLLTTHSNIDNADCKQRVYVNLRLRIPSFGSLEWDRSAFFHFEERESSLNARKVMPSFHTQCSCRKYRRFKLPAFKATILALFSQRSSASRSVVVPSRTQFPLSKFKSKTSLSSCNRTVLQSPLTRDQRSAC